MKELADRIKQKCLSAYFCPMDMGITPFGCSANESDILHQLVSPHNQFSSYNFLLPKAIREEIQDPNTGLTRVYGDDNLFVFHYPLNLHRVLIEVEEQIATQKWCEQRTSKDCSAIIKEIESIRDKIFQMDVPSCVFSRLSHTSAFPHVVGPQEITEQLSGYLKLGRQSLLAVYHGFLDSRANAQLDPFLTNPKSKVHIIDLINRPREVIF